MRFSQLVRCVTKLLHNRGATSNNNVINVNKNIKGSDMSVHCLFFGVGGKSKDGGKI